MPVAPFGLTWSDPEERPDVLLGERLALQGAEQRLAAVEAEVLPDVDPAMQAVVDRRVKSPVCDSWLLVCRIRMSCLAKVYRPLVRWVYSRLIALHSRAARS